MAAPNVSEWFPSATKATMLSRRDFVLEIRSVPVEPGGSPLVRLDVRDLVRNWGRRNSDFISLVRTNGKTYAAIKELGNDLLAEIDTSNGCLKSIIGDTGQMGFYGMGFWAGKADGFTQGGSSSFTAAA
jgi:hypothetical protein